jgi:hypothetical protein
MAPKYAQPGFNLTYNVPSIDIGSGYAAGITSAGKSLAGAISGIMGGIDPQTGQIRQGILEQNQTANDLLDQLSKTKDAEGNPILSQDAYQSIMGKSLGAKQQMLGAYMSQISSNIDQARLIAVAQATAAAQGKWEMAKTAATITGQKEIAAIKNPEDRPLNITTSDTAKTNQPDVPPQQNLARLRAKYNAIIADKANTPQF